MSIFTASDLSNQARQEAASAGKRIVDVEHLLAALSRNDDLVGKILRRIGLTPSSIRTAARAEEKDNLAAFGIDLSIEDDPPLAPNERFQLSNRALKILQNATKTKQKDYNVEVLNGLLAEPSGTISAVLTRMGITPDWLEELFDDFPSQSNQLEPEIDDANSSVSKSIFVPMPPKIAQTKLEDPQLIRHWQIGVESITESKELGTWEAKTVEHKRKKAQFNRELIRRYETSDPNTVSWELWFPDAKNPVHRTISFTLKPEDTGTMIKITFQWLNRPQTPLFRSIRRYVLQLHIHSLCSKLPQALAQ